jgi:hypothetical protein
MYSLLFRNRWFAVGWVALTLASVWTFASKDGGADRIGKSLEQFQTRREIIERPAVSPTVVVPRATAAKTVDPELLGLRPLPGSTADPAHPQAGDEFVNPVTGRRFRAIRRRDYEAIMQQGEPKDDASAAAIALP